MKRLTYRKAHRLGQLIDELFAAFPAWRTLDPATGRYSTAVQVAGSGQDITLTVPDDADEAAVATVVAAHVANANHGRDTPYENAVQYINQTIRPKLTQSPPVALTAAEQTRYNQAMLVLFSRLRREVLS